MKKILALLVMAAIVVTTIGCAESGPTKPAGGAPAPAKPATTPGGK